ncbi:MAG: fibrobacter succinogenes major paralogous domain-containing protein [bacterium]
MKSLIGLLFLFSGVICYSQTIMNIYEKDGKVTKIPTDRIEKITYEGNTVPVSQNTVTDADGNVYQTITIGNQVWMAENLKTTRYNDGTPIKEQRDFDAWQKEKTGAYCWVMNNQDTKNVYGALYNWHAVNTGKLCPKGWHVPTKQEWEMLNSYLGSRESAAQMKEVGTTYWRTSPANVTNKTGFTARPAGKRFHATGKFEEIGKMAIWWAATSANAGNAHFAVMYDNSAAMNTDNHSLSKESGFSVRCIRD